MSTSIQASVAPSGKSILLLARDAAGNPTNVTGLSSPNEVQTLTLLQPPSGQSFNLSFAGQTATIPFTVGATPFNNTTWRNLTATVGDIYSASMYLFTGSSSFLPAGYGPYPTEYYFEALDANGNIFASNHYLMPPSGPVTFTDGTLSHGGQPVAWTTIIAGVKPPTTSWSIRITCPAGFTIATDSLRVHDDTASKTQYHTATGGDVAGNFGGSNSQSTFLNDPAQGGISGGGLFQSSSNGMGGKVQIAGGAAALQAALQGLSTVGAGGITVAGQPNPNGNDTFAFTYGGPLANAAQPVLTSTDPAVVIARTQAGGITPPRLTVGGQMIQTANTDWYRTEPDSSFTGLAGPFLAYAFPSGQLYPSTKPGGEPANVRTVYAGEPPYDTGSPTDQGLTADPTFGTRSRMYQIIWNPNREVRVNFPPLPAGTYRIGANWPTRPVNSYAGTVTGWNAVRCEIRDAHGAVLQAVTVDQSVAPSGYTDGSNLPWATIATVTLATRSAFTVAVMSTGIPQASPQQYAAYFDALQLTRTSVDNSTVISPSNPVTVSVSAGWAKTAAAPHAAFSGTLTPSPILPAFDATPGRNTMGTGINVGPIDFGGNLAIFSDFTKLMAEWNRAYKPVNGYPTQVIAQLDGSGHPILPASAVNTLVGPNYGNAGDPAAGIPLGLPGLWVVRYTGPATDNWDLVPYEPHNTTVAEMTQYRQLTGGVGNIKVFNVAVNPYSNARPALYLRVSSSTPVAGDATGTLYSVGTTKYEVYPPDESDPTGQTPQGLNLTTGVFTTPPKFTNAYLNGPLGGATSIRFMDVIGANSNSCATFAQFKPDSHAIRTGLGTTEAVVTSIYNPTGPTFYRADDGALILWATVPNHPFFEGQHVGFHGCGTATFNNGGTANFDLDNANASGALIGDLHVIDANTVEIRTFTSSGVGGLTAPYTPPAGGRLQGDCGTCWSYQDMIDLVKAKPGLRQVWMSMPATIDVTPKGPGSYAFARALARDLPAGVKVVAEWANETFNAGATTVYFYVQMLQKALFGLGSNGNVAQVQAQYTKAMHAAFVGAYADAGRPTTDVIRVWMGQQASPGYIRDQLAAAAAISAPADAFSASIYFSNGPFCKVQLDQLPFFDGWDADQLCDFLEMNALYGGVAQYEVAAQVAQVAASPYGPLPMLAYEGAYELMAPADLSTGIFDFHYFSRHLAVARSPRAYHTLLSIMQECQDAGLTMWNWYNQGGYTGRFAWPLYEYGRQAAGTGDPAIDLGNAVAPLAKTTAKSELGGAWKYWADLIAGAVSKTGGSPITVKRNGMLRAIGLRRGMPRAR